MRRYPEYQPVRVLLELQMDCSTTVRWVIYKEPNTVSERQCYRDYCCRHEACYVRGQFFWWRLHHPSCRYCCVANYVVGVDTIFGKDRLTLVMVRTKNYPYILILLRSRHRRMRWSKMKMRSLASQWTRLASKGLYIAY